MASSKYIFAFICIAAALPVHGSVANHYYNQRTDTSRIDVRLPSEEKLAGYTEDDAFDYSREVPVSESIVSKIYQWLTSWLREFFNNKITGTIIEIAAYLLFIFFLILLINQYLKGNLHSMMKGDTVRNGLQLTVEKEQLKLDDLDKLIREAIQQNRYREAICLLYRKSLKRLADNEYITWKKDKTNRDYLYEMKSEKLRALFKDITYYYEYAEYGSFPVDSKLFHSVHPYFKQLNEHISSGQ